jgi:hypothetical protein
MLWRSFAAMHDFLWEFDYLISVAVFSLYSEGLD